MKTNLKLTKLIMIILTIPFILMSCGQWKRPECSKGNHCFSSFVSNKVCEAPCWQGIRPGFTSLDEAKVILDNLPFIESYDYIDRSSPPFDGKFIIRDKQNAWLGSLFLLDDKIVYMSFFGELSATFGKAEEQLAPAQKVLFFHHYLQGATINIFNFDQGVAYGTADFYNSFVHRKNSLEPDTPINTLQFFDPTLISELSEKNFFIVRKFQSGSFMENLQDWKGYGKPLELYEQVDASLYNE